METPIATISIKKHEGKTMTIEGIVDRVAQTTGPTLFSLIDGTGTLVVKGFEGAGVRAYAHIKEGDAVRATVKIREFQDALEGEIIKIARLEEDESAGLKKRIAETVRKRAEVQPIPFLVKSQVLEKLQPRFLKAATEIRLAIITNRPIIIRHHNDCDGYSAGFTLERAIIPLIAQQHGGGKAPWEYYTRSPCAAPMYEIDDSIRDTAHSLSDVAKFSNKMPLVVIVDTGSGEEDLLGIRHGRIHGIDFIVVDHHYFEKDVISSETLVHINPFLVGEDGATFSAGMLCTELARFVNNAVVLDYIPALSWLADRINNPEAIAAYLKLAEKHGYTEKLLHDIAALIDFVSAKLRFMEAREYIEVVFGEPIARQKELVSLMAPHIRKLEQRGLSIAESVAQREKIGNNTLQLLYVEESFPRGAYPKPGKCVGLLHDRLQEKEKITRLVSIGVLADLITIRATESSKFSVHELIAHLAKKVPLAFVEGGGHKMAGAIKFVPSQRENILHSVREYMKSIA